jgi:hypothetical protein
LDLKLHDDGSEMKKLGQYFVLLVAFTFSIACCNSFAQNAGFGVHTHERLNVPIPTLENLARMLDSANVRWVRIVISWMDVEPSQGQSG